MEQPRGKERTNTYVVMGGFSLSGTICLRFFFRTTLGSPVRKKERRNKTHSPREGWENGTPPPHRDFPCPVLCEGEKILFRTHLGAHKFRSTS